MSTKYTEVARATCRRCQTERGLVRRESSETRESDTVFSRHFAREGRGFCVGSFAPAPERK